MELEGLLGKSSLGSVGDWPELVDGWSYLGGFHIHMDARKFSLPVNSLCLFVLKNLKHICALHSCTSPKVILGLLHKDEFVMKN